MIQRNDMFIFQKDDFVLIWKIPRMLMLFKIEYLFAISFSYFFPSKVKETKKLLTTTKISFLTPFAFPFFAVWRKTNLNIFWHETNKIHQNFSGNCSDHFFMKMWRGVLLLPNEMEELLRQNKTKHKWHFMSKIVH
jgi:hypothetical protein